MGKYNHTTEKMKNFSLMMDRSSNGRPGFYQEDNSPSSGIGLYSASTKAVSNSSSFEQHRQISYHSSSDYSHQSLPPPPPRGPTHCCSSRDVEFMRYYSGSGGSGGGGGANYGYAKSQLPSEHFLMMRSSSSPSTSHSHDPNHNLAINISDTQDSDQVGPSSSGGCGGGGMVVVEREHMFDKVVTPSDVGKLNRLVIPKQHAERYFPLDSSTNEKGLLLNFEDRHGKPWRFRYSYWNSSQSYVMTKGWSRFVKEKKLDAGDIVSFQRGLSCKDRLFIDWRRRPDYAAVAAPSPPHSFPLPPLPRLYQHPSIITTPYYNHSFTNPQQFGFQYPNSWNQHHHHHHQHHPYYFQHQQPLSNQNNSFAHHFHQEHSSSRAGYGNPIIYVGRPPGTEVGEGFGSGSAQVIRGVTNQEEEEDDDEVGGGGEGLMVYESLPVVQGKATAKRLRLFGVNMDCPISTIQEDEELALPLTSSTALSTTAALIASRFSSSNSPLMIKPYIDTIAAASSDNNVSSDNEIPIVATQTMASSSGGSNDKGKAADSSSSMSLDLGI